MRIFVCPTCDHFHAATDNQGMARGSSHPADRTKTSVRHTGETLIEMVWLQDPEALSAWLSAHPYAKGAEILLAFPDPGLISESVLES